jgi:anti-sigma B factor antagonist
MADKGFGNRVADLSSFSSEDPQFRLLTGRMIHVRTRLTQNLDFPSISHNPTETTRQTEPPLFHLRPQCVQSRDSDFSRFGLLSGRGVSMPDQAVASLLTLVVECIGDDAEVRCSGRLVAGVNDRLYREVSQLIPSSKRILLDLTDLTHMDSTGLGTLVRLYVSAKSAGCTLLLFNVGKPIRQLLGLTHLLSVFEVIGNNNIKCG